MSKEDDLFFVAESQQGYFTSLQAEQCGYSPTNFHRYLDSGTWLKEMRGIYHLSRYPMTERPELVLWSLWSRNKRGKVRGVWSHETALDIYGLSDVMPFKLHLTVPKKFRKRDIPKILVLHFADLKDHDIQSQQGYLVTTPLRTLIDIAEKEELSRDLIHQSVDQALQRGLVTRREIVQANSKYPIPKLMRFLNDKNL